jgi:hypothetical protein
VLTVARLDTDVIVLRGVESEASSQLLKGVVVLCLPSALKVEDVHLRMTGHLRVGYVPHLPRHPEAIRMQSADSTSTVGLINGQPQQASLRTASIRPWRYSAIDGHPLLVEEVLVDRPRRA